MNSPYPLHCSIGEGDWQAQIRTLTDTIDLNYWSDFRPVTNAEIGHVQRTVNRQLPEDFRLFWSTFGCGRFPEPFGGDIYTPDEVCVACHGPMLMKLGSAEWASDDEQRSFYHTHGAVNPAPERFTADAMIVENVNVLDLLQIGTDGSCCYHQLYVGELPGPVGYCLLTDDIIEDRAQSFSDGLCLILNRHWQYHHNVDTE